MSGRDWLVSPSRPQRREVLLAWLISSPQSPASSRKPKGAAGPSRALPLTGEKAWRVHCFQARANNQSVVSLLFGIFRPGNPVETHITQRWWVGVQQSARLRGTQCYINPATVSDHHLHMHEWQP